MYLVVAEARIVLRVISDDMKKKLRDEMGKTGMVAHTASGTRSQSRRNRKSSANTQEPSSAEDTNLLDGKRQFAISQVTYLHSAKDYLRADSFSPCATLPFIIRLPEDLPVLTKSMIKTSSSFRRQRFSCNPTPATEGSSGAAQPPLGLYGENYSANGFNATCEYDSSTPHTDLFSPTLGSTGSDWPGRQGQNSPAACELGIKSLLGDDPESQCFWRNRIRRGIWRAMKRLWPAIETLVSEKDVDVLPPGPDGEAPNNVAKETPSVPSGFGKTDGLVENELVPLPAMKRVDAKNQDEQLSVLDEVTNFLGFDKNILKGASNDRIWLWAGNLETVTTLRTAKATAPPDSVLHNIFPVLQLFDIREHFLRELLKQHYGISNDKDAGSLCHHMHIMKRKFIIFGFSVTGFYAEGLMLNSMESRLIASILTVTDRRENGPDTREGVLEIVDNVYKRYFEPATPRPQEPGARDDTFENHVVFIRHAIVYSTFLDAIATGDTSSLLRCLTWIAVAFQALAPAPPSRALANEVMELVVGLHHEFARPLARAVLKSLLIARPSAPSNDNDHHHQHPPPLLPAIATHPAAVREPPGAAWLEVDFAMKAVLRQAKELFDCRMNPKIDFFKEVLTPNIGLITRVVRNAETALGTAGRAATQWKSPSETVDPDKEIPRVVQELREARVAEWLPGRRANSVADDLGRKGVDRVLSPNWAEAFYRRGDGFRSDEPLEEPVSAPAGGGGAAAAAGGGDAPAGTAAAATTATVAAGNGPATGHVKGKRNMFFNDDFAFDWGV